MITKEEYIAIAISTGREMSKHWYDKMDKMFDKINCSVSSAKVATALHAEGRWFDPITEYDRLMKA